jgi:hypothetical protein
MAYKNIFYGQLLPGSDNNVSIGSNNRRPDIITSKNFNIVYNKNEDGFYSYFKGTYSTVGSPEVDNEINLMMFAALPTANPSVQIPYFSIGEEDPVDRIDTNVLNMVAGTNAAGTNAGIYASDVDMLIRTINALNVDVSNSITSINGYLERGRTKTLGDWKTYTDSTITGLCASLVSSWVNTATISDFKYTIIGKTLIIKYILTFNFKINPTPSGNIYTDLWQLDLSNINILGTLASYSVSRYQIVSSNYVATLTNDKQMFLKIELSTGGILFWSPFGEQADESAILNKDFRFDVQSIYELT